MEQSERKALGGAVPVATLGQGGSCRPRRGRKESPRDPVATSSEARDGKPVQLALFGGLPEYSGYVTKHPAYRVWSTMIDRCYNPKNENYQWYGGCGVGVCDEWRNSSRAFVAWAICNGYDPGLQLDRRNNNLGYSPRNCSFVTCSENNLNRRDTIRLVDGRAAWPLARRAGVIRGTFTKRICRGWSPEQAAGIAPPPQRRQKAAGQAQPALDGRRRRKTDKPASQPAPGRCGVTAKLKGRKA